MNKTISKPRGPTKSTVLLISLHESSPLSVSEVCKRAAISRATFYDVVRGRFKLKQNRLRSLLTALSASPKQISRITSLVTAEKKYDRSLKQKPRKYGIINTMDKEIKLSLDDKTQKMLLLLAKCAEEKFDNAKVVREEEIACLAAAQYVKSLINKQDE